MNSQSTSACFNLKKERLMQLNGSQGKQAGQQRSGPICELFTLGGR